MNDKDYEYESVSAGLATLPGLYGGSALELADMIFATRDALRRLAAEATAPPPTPARPRPAAKVRRLVLA